MHCETPSGVRRRFRSWNAYMLLLPVLVLYSCSGGTGSEEPQVAYTVDTYKIVETSSWESIQRFVVSSDGERVVYQVYYDDLTSSASKIVSLPTTGGAPVELYDTDKNDRYIHWYDITPDGSHVVISATSDYNVGFQLYSVPIDGGELTALNEDPTYHEGLTGPSYFKITPDGRQVLYAAAATEDLRIVPIAGGPSLSLSGPLKDTLSGLSFDVDPQGVYAVYTIGYAGEENGAIYSVPLEGGNPIRLTQESIALPYPVMGNSTITPDGDRVVYVYVTVDGEASYHLAGVPITGGEALQYLQSPDIPYAQLSPYAPFFLVTYPEYAEGPEQLSAVSIIDGHVRNLSDEWDSSAEVGGYAVTPDGGHVIVGTNLNSEKFQLLSVPLEGGGADLLASSSAPAGRGGFVDFGAGGGYALYLLNVSSEEGQTTTDFYSVPLKGGASRYLCSGDRYVVSPDHEWLLCESEVLVPTTGGGSLDLTGGDSTMSWYANRIPTFAFSADKKCVVWTSQADASSPADLFVGVLREVVEE